MVKTKIDFVDLDYEKNIAMIELFIAGKLFEVRTQNIEFSGRFFSCLELFLFELARSLLNFNQNSKSFDFLASKLKPFRFRISDKQAPKYGANFV